ncbi:TIGR04282 family arsenosugar biosynthesis glycosyltransferase [Hyphococcus lacteus]|uniref:TIGR04282 family arsenosugar biosynthesis glycosyltransferase n=1 Tax=Hyphococcus lacteus TaxID=3143536 RepID=A0ABV3Z0Y5_9PROT
MRGTVVIFLKAPIAGRVKTRLGSEIGMGRASVLFRMMTKRTITEARKGGWQTVLAVDPLVAGFRNLWPPTLRRIGQGNGDLGQRMKYAMGQIADGPVIVIGADAPDMRVRHLKAAFDALSAADAVFGPAEDGGYWLVGLSRRRAAPDLFDGVRWSTKHALKDTVKSLPRDFQVALIDQLRDVDTKDDLDAMGPFSKA